MEVDTMELERLGACPTLVAGGVQWVVADSRLMRLPLIEMPSSIGRKA